MPVEEDSASLFSGQLSRLNSIENAIVETFFGPQPLDLVVGEGSGSGIGGGLESSGSNEALCLADHDVASRLLAECNHEEYNDHPALPTLDLTPDCFERPFEKHRDRNEDSATYTTVDSRSVSTAIESSDAQQGVEQDDQWSYASVRFSADDQFQSFPTVPNSSASWESAGADKNGPPPNLHDIAQLSPLPRFVEHPIGFDGILNSGNDKLKSPVESELRAADAPFAEVPSAENLPAGPIPPPVAAFSNARLVPEAEISSAERPNLENPAARRRDSGTNTCIDHPQDHDVICGRGNATNNHPGNKWYLERVEEQKANYDAANKAGKSTIATGVVRLVRARDPSGRFLKQDQETGFWIDIGDVQAVEKAKAAMRQRGADVVEQNPHRLEEATDPVQSRIFVPRPEDFLNQKGGVSVSHEGNRRLRDLAEPQKFLYKILRSHEKAPFAKSILDAWRSDTNPQGRVLRPVGGAWQEMTERRAIEMVMGILRRDPNPRRAESDAQPSTVASQPPPPSPPPPPPPTPPPPPPNDNTDAGPASNCFDSAARPPPPPQTPRSDSVGGAPCGSYLAAHLQPSTAQVHNGVQVVLDPVYIEIGDDEAIDEALETLREKPTAQGHGGGVIGVLHANDFILQRRGNSISHDGNVRLRDLAEPWKPKYRKFSRPEKRRCAKSILDEWRNCANPRGRVLRVGDDGMWHELPEETAVKAVMEILRGEPNPSNLPQTPSTESAGEEVPALVPGSPASFDAGKPSRPRMPQLPPTLPIVSLGTAPGQVNLRHLSAPYPPGAAAEPSDFGATTGPAYISCSFKLTDHPLVAFPSVSTADGTEPSFGSLAEATRSGAHSLGATDAGSARNPAKVVFFRRVKTWLKLLVCSSRGEVLD